jgi:hypothetical protein
MDYKNKYLKYFEKNKQMGGSIQEELYNALLACNDSGTCNEKLIEELSGKGADILARRSPTGDIVLYEVLQELHNRGIPLKKIMLDAIAIPLSAYLRQSNFNSFEQKINQRSSPYTIPILSLAISIALNNKELDEDELVKGLIGFHADINATYEPTKNTPLMQAVYQQKVSICKILIKAGANKGLTNSDGDTAFALATKLAARNHEYNDLLQYLH